MFLLIYFTHITHYNFIYALNDIYVSIPVFWAVLQHHSQQQLSVCKQLYISRQQAIKLLPKVAETVLNSPYSMKSYSNLRFQSEIQIDIQRPGGRWKGGKRDEHYYQW